MLRIRRISPEAAVTEMAGMEVDPAGIGIMSGKAAHLVLHLGDIDLKAAMIVKQDMLSLGGEAALSRSAASLKPETTPVLLMGTATQLQRLVEKLAGQPFGLAELGAGLKEFLRQSGQRTVFNVDGSDILGEAVAAVMGILNVTDDSFSDGGRFLDAGDAVAQAAAMSEQGAAIVDVGGQSTRPGAGEVAQEVELARVVPVVSHLAETMQVPLSVDTTRSEVAAEALAAGASIVNDISGMTFDERMPETAAKAGAAVVLMHTRGRPDYMQEDLQYDDLVGEVYRYLEDAVDRAVSAGIERGSTCIDPGIGFGKSFEQNLVLLNRLGEFASLGCAVMVGVSRKSFIGHYLDAAVDDRLEGSLAAASAAVLRGAHLVRAHDVKETLRAVRMAGLIRDSWG